MNRTARYTAQAHTDIFEILEYLEERNPSAANRFIEALDAELNHTSWYPLAAPLQQYVDDPDLVGIRIKLITDFPRYLIFYRVDGENVTILRILHGGGIANEPRGEHSIKKLSTF